MCGYQSRPGVPVERSMHSRGRGGRRGSDRNSRRLLLRRFLRNRLLRDVRQERLVLRNGRPIRWKLCRKFLALERDGWVVATGVDLAFQRGRRIDADLYSVPPTIKGELRTGDRWLEIRPPVSFVNVKGVPNWPEMTGIHSAYNPIVMNRMRKRSFRSNCRMVDIAGERFGQRRLSSCARSQGAEAPALRPTALTIPVHHFAIRCSR